MSVNIPKVRLVNGKEDGGAIVIPKGSNSSIRANSEDMSPLVPLLLAGGGGLASSYLANSMLSSDDSKSAIGGLLKGIAALGITGLGAYGGYQLGKKYLGAQEKKAERGIPIEIGGTQNFIPKKYKGTLDDILKGLADDENASISDVASSLDAKSRKRGMGEMIAGALGLAGSGAAYSASGMGEARKSYDEHLSKSKELGEKFVKQLRDMAAERTRQANLNPSGKKAIQARQNYLDNYAPNRQKVIDVHKGDVGDITKKLRDDIKAIQKSRKIRLGSVGAGMVSSLLTLDGLRRTLSRGTHGEFARKLNDGEFRRKVVEK